MSSASDRSTLERVLATSRVFQAMAKAPTLGSYLAPPLAWNPPCSAFPARPILESVIRREAGRLYGEETARVVAQAMKARWCVESGAHLHLPRRQDRVTRPGLAQANPLILQGQILWLACHKALGAEAALSLNTGLTPLDGKITGTYLDLAERPLPTRLLSSKFARTPHVLAPLPESATIDRARRAVALHAGRGLVTDRESRLQNRYLDWFDPQIGHLTFGDRVGVGHSDLVREMVPEMPTYITLDLVRIASSFLADCLSTKETLIGRIFSNSSLVERFYDHHRGIATGWKDGETLFWEVLEGSGRRRLTDSRKFYPPSTLPDALRTERVFPRTLLGFWCLLVEGGLCAIGARRQCEYLTTLKNRAAVFLKQVLREEHRADAVMQLPLDRATFGPGWGGSQYGLVVGLDLLRDPLSAQECRQIVALSGRESLRVSAAALKGLIFDEPVAWGDSEVDQLCPVVRPGSTQHGV